MANNKKCNILQSMEMVTFETFFPKIRIEQRIEKKLCTKPEVEEHRSTVQFRDTDRFGKPGVSATSFLIFLSLGCYVIPTRSCGLQNWFRLIQKIQNVLTLHLFACILVCASKCIYKVFALLSHSVFLKKKKKKKP